MKRNSQSTKDKILNISIKIFAEKGFDGARVDDIALQSKVNKALIYYYFKSKNGILRTIFDKFIKEANNIILELAYNNISFDTDESDQYMQKYSEYLMNNSDILKIMMIESVKANKETPSIFKLIDFPAQPDLDENKVIEDLNKRGLKLDRDKNQRMITEFFTGIIPEICMIIFQKKWCEYFKIEKQDFFNMFKKAIEMTHTEHYKHK